MALTKERLISSLYDQVGLSKKQSQSVMEQTLNIIKTSLEKGEDVLISGFGKFSVKEKQSRRGRNPQTSEEMRLRARRVVIFKASGVLRDRLNSN